MYFLTYGGFSIYDGVKFKNYRKQDGLADELVNDIIEITPDSFLVATNSPSLNTLVRGKIGIFETVDNFYPVINKFVKSNDGSLYVIADDGFFVFRENKFVKLPVTNSEGIYIRNLAQITEWNNYFLMIPWNYAQKEKLIIYDKVKNEVTGISSKAVSNTAVSPKGELWLSSSEGIEMLDLPSLQKGKFVFKPVPKLLNSYNLSYADIYFDLKGDTWISQYNEVLHIDSEGKKQIISNAQGLRISNLSDFIVDREGIIWMASDGNGIVKMPGTNVQIISDLLPGTQNNISSMQQQSDTTWCFNRTNNCFYRIHENHVTSFPIPGKKVNVLIIHIVGNSLYFMTDNKIFAVENKDLLSSYAHPVQMFSEPEAVEIGIGMTDPNGNIIHCIRFKDENFYLVVFRKGKMLMSTRLSFIADQLILDKNGYLWVPTRDNHLLKYSLHPETPFEYLRLENSYPQEFPAISPRSITADKSGNIWLGTRYKGIYILQFQSNKITSSIQLTTTEGLTDNFHYKLHCDPQNNIWAGSQTGLDKISFKNGEYIIENITKSKNIFQGITQIINVTNQIIWALTTNGNIISVSNINSERTYPTPSFFISGHSVNDSLIDPTSSVFSHDQNNFSVTVAAPSFMDEKSIQYSYRLKGSGKNDWSEPSNNAQLNFINLAPGVYELNIKADFPAKIYPTQQIQYAFVIRPPFWRTWWFLSLIVLLILTALVFAVRYYYNRKLEIQKIILERKQAIEKERTRIATDMHDDLGAGLSRIKFLSETIGIKKQMHQPIETEIDNIRNYAHEMIDKMGEIVWALNEKNDSLSDLLSYTRAYAVEYLAENGIQGNIDKLPPLNPRMVNGEFRRNIYLSVKEALHNVIKHAKADDIFIHFQVTDHLVITIHDNGIGFNGTQHKPYTNGLTNMQKRMEEIGGNMNIVQDNGTRVILTAPLPT